MEGRAFGILHASGVYLDIISEGIKAFCYMNETDFPLVEQGMDSFSTVSELLEKIKRWEAFSANEKKEYMNHIRDYYLYPNNVENEYKSFIKRLNNRIKLG